MTFEVQGSQEPRSPASFDVAAVRRGNDVMCPIQS